MSFHGCDFIIMLTILLGNCYSVMAQDSLTSNEKLYVNLFDGFIGQVVKQNNENKNINHIETYLPNNISQNKRMDSLVRTWRDEDTAEKKFILTHYFVTGNDSLIVHEHWNKDSLLNVGVREFYPAYWYFLDFINSLGNEGLKNLKVEPIRFFKDKFYYNNFLPYQRKNSIVFFDKRNPDKLLGVVLCVPPGKIYKGSPARILGWTLVFENGRFHFKDVYGGDESGEFIFEYKVGSPKYPVDIRKELAPFSTSPDANKTQLKIEKSKAKPIYQMSRDNPSTN